jgi:F-type H+-transporting ATPase subunit b
LRGIAPSTLPAPRLACILPVLLFAALGLALMAAPRGARAQQSPSAAPPTAHSKPSRPDDTDEAARTTPEDEQKMLNVFRHAPLVAKIGQKMGLDVEVTAKIFEAINFVIIILAIVLPLVRVLPRALRNRTETLNREIKTAREATSDAQSRLSAVEAKLAGLAEEIAKFRAQVEHESLEDEKRIKASIAEESARILATAEQEIAAAAAQARRGLRHFAADLAIGQAEKQLALTPETDRALISEFIGEVARNGGSSGSNGGAN